jgi:hypothetical protein
MEASSDLTACSGYDTLGSTYCFLSLGPQEKQLYIFDPKSLYQILVKVCSYKRSRPELGIHRDNFQDQDIFEEADSNLYGSLVLFGEGILATSGALWMTSCFTHLPRHTTIGEQHKKQRKMLNPVFSAAHLRQMGAFFF